MVAECKSSKHHLNFIKVLDTFKNLSKIRSKPAINQIFRQLAYEKVAWIHGQGADPRHQEHQEGRNSGGKRIRLLGTRLFFLDWPSP